jgi:hypothetical protein
MRVVVYAALFSVILVSGIRCQDQRPQLGAQIKEFEFLDIRYMRRSLADFDEQGGKVEAGDAKEESKGIPVERRGYVLFFVTNTCPLVLRYLPRVRELARKYSRRGIQFVAVNVGAGDTIVEMAASAVEHDIPIPFVKDATGEVYRALGVQRTATAVVLDKGRRLHYRGRINRRYRFSGVSPDAGREDLELAIEDLLASRKAVVGETSVEGCKITKPRKHAQKGLTYSRDIAPIVQKSCQDCHRPDGDAPFALMGYSDVADRSEMIAEVVLQRRMPPWYGSASYGKFVNHRGLSDAEIGKIASWVEDGTPEGDPKHLPKPRVFEKREWRIDKPDLVLKLPFRIKIPAEGYVPYKYFVFPYRFKEDTWIEQIEILPTNRKVLHHANISRMQGTKYRGGGFITGQVPGGDPMVLDPGTAVKVSKGSVIAIQCHYVTTGKKEWDRLRLGIRFPRIAVRRQLHHLQIGNNRFLIPPGDPHHKVSRTMVLPCDAEGLGMFVHMHLRGKDMSFTAVHPEGKSERLLLVPNYNFDWQQSYRWKRGTVFFKRGTRIQVDAHFDNSAFNPFNPDPHRAVPYGAQTKDEMMFGFFFYFQRGEELDIRVDPKNGHVLAVK